MRQACIIIYICLCSGRSASVWVANLWHPHKKTTKNNPRVQAKRRLNLTKSNESLANRTDTKIRRYIYWANFRANTFRLLPSHFLLFVGIWKQIILFIVHCHCSFNLNTAPSVPFGGEINRVYVRVPTVHESSGQEEMYLPDTLLHTWQRRMRFCFSAAFRISLQKASTSTYMKPRHVGKTRF